MVGSVDVWDVWDSVRPSKVQQHHEMKTCWLVLSPAPDVSAGVLFSLVTLGIIALLSFDVSVLKDFFRPFSSNQAVNPCPCCFSILAWWRCKRGWWRQREHHSLKIIHSMITGDELG